jgi:hypothetical protein
MKKFILSLYQFCLFIFVLIVASSCVKHPDSPGYEYVDDMFRSQAIEAYIDYGLVGDKVNDTLKNTISARIPVKGTIAFSKSKKNFYYQYAILLWIFGRRENKSGRRSPLTKTLLQSRKFSRI